MEQLQTKERVLPIDGPKKQRTLIKFMVIYFLIHIVLYSSHNYRELLTRDVFGIGKKHYSYVEMISVIKLLATVGCTQICGHRVRPLLATTISIGILMLSVALLILQVFKHSYLNIGLGLLYLMADSVVIPTVDAECLALLHQYEMTAKYSRIRIFSTIGQALVYPINYLLQVHLFQEASLLKTVLTSTLVFGALSIVGFVYTLMTVDPVVSDQPKPVGRKTNYSFSLLGRPAYLLIMVCTLGIGISRTSFQSYLTTYLNHTRGNDKEQYLIYFLRTLSELFVWSVVIWLRERASLEMLFPLSLFLGSLRCILYTIDFQQPQLVLVTPYLAEILKAVFSPLFIYVSTRLAFKYAEESERTFALGLFTGVYSGLAPFVAGVLSFTIFSVYEDKLPRHAQIERLFSVVGWIGFLATFCGLYFYLRRRQRKLIIHC